MNTGNERRAEGSAGSSRHCCRLCNPVSGSGDQRRETGKLALPAFAALSPTIALIVVPVAPLMQACDFVARWRAVLHAFVLALAVAGAACAVPPAAPGQPAHRVWVVHHGHHSGIVVRAAEVAPQAWPARRDLPQAEFLEVGWGDRDYYMAQAPGLWLGVRALLWPTPAVLHVVAFDGPFERYFIHAGVFELTLTASGLEALVGAVRDSLEGVPAPDANSAVDGPPPLGPGLYGASRFYASRERFHLFRTCNVWAAGVLAAAGVPLHPTTALTADALFAQLRPHGRLLREPP